MEKFFNEMSPEEQEKYMTQMKKHSSLERVIQSRINEILYRELNHIIDDPEINCIKLSKNDQSLRVTIWFDRDEPALKPYKTDDERIWDYIVNHRCLKKKRPKNRIKFNPSLCERRLSL